MAVINLINGPNLNLFGTREPEIYGKETLDQIVASLTKAAESQGFSLEAFQSNHEGELIDKIQGLANTTAGIIINPAALSHTSIALRDALAMVKKPIIEVHSSNIYKREEFRHHSYVSAVATGVVAGLGAYGYDLAMQALLRVLKSS